MASYIRMISQRNRKQVFTLVFIMENKLQPENGWMFSPHVHFRYFVIIIVNKVIKMFGCRSCVKDVFFKTFVINSEFGVVTMKVNENLLKWQVNQCRSLKCQAEFLQFGTSH